jgi:hypothetical protein
MIFLKLFTLNQTKLAIVQLNKTNLAIFVQVYSKEQTQFGDSYATN